MGPVLAWLLGPSVPTIADLMLLAQGGRRDAAVRLHELLDWRIQRAMMVVKGTIGTSVSFVVTLVVTQFKHELQIPSGWVAAAVVAAVLVSSFGLYTLRQLAHIGTQYPRLLALLALLP